MNPGANPLFLLFQRALITSSLLVFFSMSFTDLLTQVFPEEGSHFRPEMLWLFAVCHTIIYIYCLWLLFTRVHYFPILAIYPAWPPLLFQLFHILTVYQLYCQDAFREHNLFLTHDFLTAWFVFMFAENFKTTVTLGQRITFVKLHGFLECISDVGNSGCDKTTARLKGKSWKDRKAKSVPAVLMCDIFHIPPPPPCLCLAPCKALSKVPQSPGVRRWFPKVTCQFCPAKKPRWTFWVCTFKRYASALQDIVQHQITLYFLT